MAHLEAGCDEVLYSQKISWKLNGVKGDNEIDVIACRGDILSFTTCKSMIPEYSSGNADIIWDSIMEADYWDHHFADGKGKVLMVCTADFYNEYRYQQHRYPRLAAKATILEVNMVGLEELKWDCFVRKILEHWD